MDGVAPLAMTWADYAVLVVIGVSALISLVRGFVREALSLAGWVLALWLAVAYSEAAGEYLSGQISVPSARQAVAFLAIFMGVLLATGVVVWAIGVVVDRTGMSGTDRMLGIVFGVARGALVVTLLVLLAGLTPLPDDPWWRSSVLVPHFERAAREARGWMPPEIREHFEFDAEPPAPASPPAPVAEPPASG